MHETSHRKVLYYLIAVNNTMLFTLVCLETKYIDRKLCNKKVANNILQFLNYSAMHINATLRYHSSGTIIHMEIDLSYLSVSNIRIRVSVHH